ncbi:MAG TPA: septum formation initiator family protein [Terriglobales bacterium]|jgi:cell division protein FtsB
MKITIRIAGHWLYQMRRLLATVCIALLALLIGYKVVFGANGMKVWQAKRAEVQRLQSEIDQKQMEQQLLQHEVDGLQRGDPGVIEKEAREQLGYVKPGEVVLYQQKNKPDPRTAPAVAENTGQK